MEEAKIGMIGGGDFRLAIFNARNLELHVRLTGAEPDFADQHVVDNEGRDRLSPSGQGMRAARRERRELGEPFAVGPGGCHGAISGEFDRDLSARFGPAPNRDFNFPLEDRVIAK